MAKLKIDWKVFAESIGMMTIVLSLVFVGLQLRQSQNPLLARCFDEIYGKN